MVRITQIPAAFAFLSIAIIVYSLFGSPTPDSPGIVEAVVGAFLVLAVGTGAIRGVVNFGFGRNIFLKSLQILFLCGLLFPTITGVYYGNDTGLLIRDVLAFAFLGLPLFLSEKIAGNETASRFMPLLLVFAGLCFALRTLLPVFNIWIPQGELLYLSNSPLTLFAGVYLAGLFWANLQMPGRRGWVLAFACFAGLALLFSAMILDVQRATIGAMILSLIILALYSFVKTPQRTIVPILVLAVVGVLLYPFMMDALQAMAMKTVSVGWNARAQEAVAVFDVLAAAPEGLFVGKGWGSVFASPAVAGLDVNYTHSFLTTMALKGGIIMLALSVLTVLAALYEIFLIFQRDKVRGLALFWPLVVPVFLYASHKSLDFGLLLLLIGVWSTQLGPLRHGAPSVKPKRTSLNDQE